MISGQRIGRPTPGLSIGDVSKITNVEVHTLRYWENEFEPYLDPPRTAGGQRRYRSQDIEAVFEIKKLLRDEMFSIAGAKRFLARKLKSAA